MARHIWSVLCSKVVTDSASQNVSLIDVLEQLDVTVTRAKVEQEQDTVIVPFSGQLVSLWGRGNLDEGEDVSGRVRFISPSGEELEKTEYSVDLSNYPRVRTVFKMNGFPVRMGEVGNYCFSIEQASEQGGWDVVAEVAVQVKIIVTTEGGGNCAP